MKFGSVCSGIEAASVAWNPLGWKAQWLAEIEPFPCAVLAHHYPDTPNLGDMTKFNEWPTDDKHSIDLLCGGTPCQSFSVAGLRKGLDDPRGNLMLTFGSIAAKYRPQWLVWENVPGVLSSNGGRDFGSFLGMLGQLGYGFAYRVLDAQYFGVAQRRRRVFVVGCLGDWRSAAAVLFERHSLQGNPAPRRQAGQRPTGTLSARTEGGGGLGTDFECSGGIQPVAGTMKSCKDSGGWSNSADHAAAGYMIPVGTLCVATGQAGAEIGAEIGADMAPTLNCNHEAPYAMYQTSHTLRGEGFDASEDGTGRGTPLVPCIAFPERMSGTQCASTENLAPSMGALNPSAVAYTTKLHNTASNQAGKIYEEYTVGLDSNSPPPALLTAMQVRRLTPRECERLQGFTDDYTLIPHGRRVKKEKLDHDFIKYQMRGNPKHLTREDVDRLAADGPRYKALGNSWAVPNVRWIGERLDAVAEIINEQKAAA